MADESILGYVLDALGPSSAEAALTPKAMRGGVEKAKATARAIEEAATMWAATKKHIPKTIRSRKDIEVNRRPSMEDIRELLRKEGTQQGDLPEDVQRFIDNNPPLAYYEPKSGLGPYRTHGGKETNIHEISVPHDMWLKEPEFNPTNVLFHEYGHLLPRLATKKSSSEELAQYFADRTLRYSDRGLPISDKGLQFYKKGLSTADVSQLKGTDYVMESAWKADAWAARGTQRKWDAHRALKEAKLKEAITKEQEKMEAYKNKGGQVIRKAASDAPVFKGVQKIQDYPDQYVYNDPVTDSTFYSFTQDPIELQKHMEEMREKFRAAGNLPKQAKTKPLMEQEFMNDPKTPADFAVRDMQRKYHEQSRREVINELKKSGFADIAGRMEKADKDLPAARRRNLAQEVNRRLDAEVGVGQGKRMEFQKTEADALADRAKIHESPIESQPLSMEFESRALADAAKENIGFFPGKHGLKTEALKVTKNPNGTYRLERYAKGEAKVLSESEEAMAKSKSKYIGPEDLEHIRAEVAKRKASRAKKESILGKPMEKDEELDAAMDMLRALDAGK